MGQMILPVFWIRFPVVSKIVLWNLADGNHRETNDGFKNGKIYHNSGKNASGIIFLCKEAGNVPFLLC